MFRTFGPLMLGGLLFAGCAGGGDLDKVDDKGVDDSDNVYRPDETDTYRGETADPTNSNGGRNGSQNNGGRNGGQNGGQNGGSHTGAFPFPPGGSGFPSGGSGFPSGGSGFPSGGSGFPSGGSGFPSGGSGFPSLPFLPDGDGDGFLSGTLPQPLPPLGSQPEALFAFP